MTTLEQVIESVGALPLAERRRLLQHFQQDWPVPVAGDSAAAPSDKMPLIEVTGRGPCIAGRRTTLYVVHETFVATGDREFVKRHLLLTDEQLDAALDYIERNKEQFLRDYNEIVRISNERRAHYEKLFWERSRFAPDTPPEERVRVMRELLRERRAAEAQSHENQNPV